MTQEPAVACMLSQAREKKAEVQKAGCFIVNRIALLADIQAGV
jgi:hypothetical protein